MGVTPGMVETNCEPTMIVSKEILRVEAGASFCMYDHREPEPMMDMHTVTQAACIERGSPTPLVHIDGGCIDLQCVFCGAEFLTRTGRAGPCIICGVYLD